MSTLLQDLRFAWRSLARAPGFALVVIGTLALGVGANSLIFSVVNTFVFRPMPHFDEARLVRFSKENKALGESFEQLSYPDFADIRERARSFESVAGYYESSAYLTLDREPERYFASVITSGLFETIGAPPVLGREFQADEEKDGNQWASIMISHRIWKERFGGDPNVLGRTIKMNGRVRTVVGVAPEGVRFPETADFFIPLGFVPSEDSRASNYIDTIGRLKPGATLEQARAEVNTIAHDIARRFPESHKDVTIGTASFRSLFVKEMLPVMSMLMAAVGFVLLIACANIANLMLARGAGRTREVGLRVALGASRGRIVRQFLTESLLVALIGGGIGILLAQLGMDLVLSSIPQELPFWMDFGLDVRVLLYTVGICVVAAVLFGLAPALQVSTVDPHEALKEGGIHGTTRHGNRIRSALVVAEISLALVLLTGAGLMIRSFVKRMDESRVIAGGRVLTGTVTLPVAVYKDDAARLAFYDALFPAIEALPGVEAAGAVQVLPLGRNSWRRRIAREGVEADLEKGRLAFYGITRPGYFRTIGLPIRSGRDFTMLDGPDAEQVAIVNESAARAFWPDQDPIGRRFKWGREDTTGWTRVVGVVPDVRQAIRESDPTPHIFVPHRQDPQQTLVLTVATSGDPAALATPLRQLVQSRDPDLPVYSMQTLQHYARQSLWEERIYVWLMGVFAVLALVIAAVGIYGVMAYSVSQRTQEIGIRMALGAASHDVIRMVVGQAMRLTAIGVGIGLAAAYGVTRLMASLLFGVSAADPPTFAGVAVILAASGIVAAWVPTLRATRVDPMAALRSE